jgi:hypothetical protein
MILMISVRLADRLRMHGSYVLFQVERKGQEKKSIEVTKIYGMILLTEECPKHAAYF